ncbi:hypothetical protein [uncultured Methylibium sp.]|uniref:hypothetical protein n=1 Tax=uncultured Methylibium sp. TaxID=381093 RepID=UPI0025CC29E7|nr:hypothetical protein [uncultured Methylibium sp.]
MRLERQRIGQAATVIVVAMMSGACGGGGGGDTAISAGTTPTPSPVAGDTTAPEPATPVPEPSKPPPALVEIPAPVDATPVPGVARSSVIRALSQATDQLTVDIQGAFDLSHDVTGKAFSTVRSATAQGRLTAVSTFTLPREAVNTFQREVVLSVAIDTDGATRYAFTGTGSVTSPSGQTSISAAPYSLPDPVPFDRTLHQLNVTGSSPSSIRFFVGTIEDRPELMRLCWRVELPGILRVACTRNSRSTGDVAGADTVNDLGGTLYFHENEIGDAFEPTVLRCLEQTFNAPDIETRTSLFGIAAYDRSKSDGGLLPPPARFYSGSVRVPAGGQVEYQLDYNPPAAFVARTTALVTNDRVVHMSHGVMRPFYNLGRECN